MQVPKRHFPVVGIIGLIVIAAAGGGIYYYQFVISHTTSPYTPVHRLVFMTAVIVEGSTNGHGFSVNGASYLNQSTLPNFNESYGPTLTGVKYTNYTVSSSTEIDARVGDTITFYIQGINDTTTMCGSSPCQIPGIPGHGFAISGPSPVMVDSGSLPCGQPSCSIPLGGWYSVTVTFQVGGTYTYFCTIVCSPLHGNMNGSIVVT
jgi:plastocyanin